MASRDVQMRETWEASFAEQVARDAYNTAPVEAVVRNIAYWLRDVRPDGDFSGLQALEMGSGAGPNLLWLAQKGIRVSGIDISPTALELSRGLLSPMGELVGDLVEGSVSEVPLPDGSFDIVLESCVFQHLAREDRRRAFAEVGRLLRPGGLFAGHMLEQGHTVFGRHRDEQLPHDPGTLQLEEGGSKFHLTNIGLSHFFSAAELPGLLPGFSTVDPCLVTYELPRQEAARRGYHDGYRQSMLAVFAVK
jgi:SAM-dependent methyltransferase